MSPVESTTVRNGRPKPLQDILGIGGQLFVFVQLCSGSVNFTSSTF